MKIIRLTNKNTGIELRKLFNAQKSGNTGVEAIAAKIIGDVAENGDSALRRYAYKFDGVRIKDLGVSASEMKKAYSRVDKTLYNSLTSAKKNISEYHKKQLPKSWSFKRVGAKLGLRYTPLETVGIYVP